jgi:hypothetical protein
MLYLVPIGMISTIGSKVKWWSQHSCLGIDSSKHCPAEEYWALNIPEDWLVFGVGEIISRALGTFNRQYAQYQSQSNDQVMNHLMTLTEDIDERLEDYYCGGSKFGCKRRITLHHVNDGLVVFKLTDDHHGNVIKHNIYAHNCCPTHLAANAFSLTEAQKVVVTDLQGKMKPSDIACEIATDLNLSSPEQTTNYNQEFANRFSQWICKPATMSKEYFCHFLEHQVMTKHNQVEEEHEW